LHRINAGSFAFIDANGDEWTQDPTGESNFTNEFDPEIGKCIITTLFLFLLLLHTNFHLNSFSSDFVENSEHGY